MTSVSAVAPFARAVSKAMVSEDLRIFVLLPLYWFYIAPYITMGFLSGIRGALCGRVGKLCCLDYE
jgi:hypothetical protein